jgi:arylsulfatase A-like enzyme
MTYRVALLLLSACLLPLAADAGDRPNILLILADDLGYGDLGCYGHPRFRTPRIDRMAAEGARLTQFNTPTPFCAPTRASLLTGRYPVRCGMNLNPTPDAGPAYDRLFLPKSEQTLAEILHRAGYATGIIGKWHLGHYPGTLPTDRGFDEYFGIPYSNDMRPVKLLQGKDTIEYPVVQANLTERYTQRAVDFIERHRERPFFLYLPHAMPHKPLAASEKHYKQSTAGLYGDVLAELDESIGRVLDCLKQNKLDEKTLIFFTSDNGPWYGGSTGGLRGMKGSTYEGGFRVPMIARWPGQIPAGQTIDQLAVMMDLFATTLKVTETQVPDARPLDGRDLMPMLTQSAPSPHPFLFGQQGERLATVRDGRWKLHVAVPKERMIKVDASGRWIDPRAPDGVTILAPFEQYNIDAVAGNDGGDAPAPMQLFDLGNDPAEKRDVSAAHPDEVHRLKAAFDQMLAEFPQAAPHSPPARPN